jgi:hypothetical protein
MIVAAFKSGQYGMGLLAILNAALSEILGDIPFIGPDVQENAETGAEELQRFQSDPQGYLQEKLHEAFGSPAPGPGLRRWHRRRQPVCRSSNNTPGSKPRPARLARSFRHSIGLPGL